MKWSHDYKRDVSHPNETQIRNETSYTKLLREMTTFSIQFKALFRVDINHTYNTSSNELLKSTSIKLVLNN
jgi:hypothetical protein